LKVDPDRKAAAQQVIEQATIRRQRAIVDAMDEAPGCALLWLRDPANASGL